MLSRDVFHVFLTLGPLRWMRSLLVLAEVKIKGQEGQSQGNADAGDAGDGEERNGGYRHHS